MPEDVSQDSPLDPTGIHLVYLASIDFPIGKARAIQVVNTCHALARARCRVTLVVGRREAGSNEGHLSYYGLLPHHNLRIVGVPALRLPPALTRLARRMYSHFWNWTYLAGCLRILPALLRDRPTALLARDYRLAWLLGRLGWWHRLPIVFEVHGLPSAELLDSRRLTAQIRREARRCRRLEEGVFASAARLLPITDCLRQRLLSDYGVDPARVVTVPDAGPSPREQPTRPERWVPPGALSSGRRRPRLVYVGQLYPWKGVELAIRALALVPRAELIVVGGLPDDPYRPTLERLANQLGIAERLRFTGPTEYRDVPHLLAEADVALLPLAPGIVADCFTSPLKLFDYLAAGLPIVACDFPTIREILRDGHNALLVSPDDAGAMAAAIERLLEEPELAQRLGSQARRDAHDYTWERRASRILAALPGLGGAVTPSSVAAQ